MRILNTTTQFPNDTLGRLSVYSGMDVLSLFQIKDGISALMDENRWNVYKFEMELQSPLLSLSLKGIPVDEAARRDMIKQFSKDQNKLTELINLMLDSIGYFDYYRAMAVAEFSNNTGVQPEILPHTWDDWKDLSIAFRKECKKISPAALEVFQKALKEFSTPFNPLSSSQKLRLFYHFFGSPANAIAANYFFSPPWLKTHGIPEYKSRNTKGDYTPAVNREALEKIIKASDNTNNAAYWAAPFAHVCLVISDLSKSLGFLNCKLEHGLFKSSFGAVTETGRLASRQNAQGYGSNAQNVAPKLRHIFIAPPGEKFVMVDYAQIESRIVAAICFRLFGATNYIAMTECLTGDHEVFTPNGWISIKEKPASLACWNAQDKRITFQSPLRWVEYDAEETMTIKTKCFSLTATPNHTVPYVKRSGDCGIAKQTMKDAYNKTQFHVKLSGYYSGHIDINPVYAQLLAAYQADGYLNERAMIEFSFSKPRKIKRLMQLLAQANIPYTTNQFPNYKGYEEPTTRFYIRYTDWRTVLNKKAGSYLLDWSSAALTAYTLEHEYWDAYRERSLSYRITNQDKTHLEWVATIAHLIGMSATAPTPDHDSWRISIRKSSVTNIGTEAGVRYTTKSPCTVYCPTVSTGFFLVRKDGFISITGNCGDAHSLCSAMVWDNLPWPEDFTLDWTIKHGPFPKDLLKAAKKISSEKFYRGKSRRDVSKTLGHGCLTADHEVLTPTGWVSIDTKPNVIMQSDGRFVPVSNWIDKEYSGTFVLWEGQNISLLATANHRIYYKFHKKPDFSIKPAVLVPKTARIPLCMDYHGGTINEPLAALLAAYHCSGSYTGRNETKFRLHSKIKIDRLINLANKLNIPFTCNTNKTIILLDWTPKLHTPCWSMLDWNKESLSAYMDEVKYWSGVIKDSSTYLYSKSQEHLEVWQMLNRLLGNGGNINGHYSSGYCDGMYYLQENNRKFASRTSFYVDEEIQSTMRVYCPTVPSEAFYVRRYGRICVVGNSNYLGKPPQMAKQSHIDIKLIEHYQSVYFATCPELLLWHRWVAEQVQTKGEITTMLGRTRRFFGRPNDDATIREAVAYEPQSVAADYCNRALLRLHKLELSGEFPATIRLSKHDELVVSCKENLEEKVVSMMVEQMEEHITLTAPNGAARDWYIPAECETGWNLGKKSDTNPNGVSHPLDGRTRTVALSWKNWKL